MSTVAESLRRLLAEIAELEARHGREPGSVRLLAVSKTKPAELVREAAAAGQRAFGENFLQEAQEKIHTLGDLDLEWHFIGPIQSNKTRGIATDFQWVHSVDRLKVAQRLSAQRPAELPPLDICVQVNVSGEGTKSGVEPGEVEALAHACAELPRIRVRGLMAIPAPADSLEAQRRPFRVLREMLDRLRAGGLELDTLSMGMSGDMEAAIAEGATIVRIGTAVFGARNYD
ncbi:MAG: YggS family pyridoxal phosphate-dependent enzyme [Ectothiorhodospiraceae bacterium]|nr:YggS family pyridoxal phosphate-dependent enzyme [Chromatiales bacterium]MCP5157321.1 YggS family pyridoxal phosphate-dependent enzyme [Ectothiorhodospiraceae bacterium]